VRYAITGATGFVGGEVVRQLRDDGHEVRALVRDPDRAAALAGLGVELITGDLADLAALRRLTDGTDGLFHLAGWKLSDLHPELAGPVNVEGTRNALTAARETGVPRVVHTSAIAVNSDTHGGVVGSRSVRGTHRTSTTRPRRRRTTSRSPPPRRTAGRHRHAGLVARPGDTELTASHRQVAQGRLLMVPAGGGLLGALWTLLRPPAGHAARNAGESMLAGPRGSVADGLTRSRRSRAHGRRPPAGQAFGVSSSQPDRWVPLPSSSRRSRNARACPPTLARGEAGRSR
jgi:dihydroflavonol-4-reductase